MKYEGPYQGKFETLELAVKDAKERSLNDRRNEYTIIESTTDGKRVFYVEADSGFVRNWETHHGTYIVGKKLED